MMIIQHSCRSVYAELKFKIKIVCVCMDVSIYRFDLSKANLNDANLEKMNPADIPDVVRGDTLHDTCSVAVLS